MPKWVYTGMFDRCTRLTYSILPPVRVRPIEQPICPSCSNESQHKITNHVDLVFLYIYYCFSTGSDTKSQIYPFILESFLFPMKAAFVESPWQRSLLHLPLLGVLIPSNRWDNVWATESSESLGEKALDIGWSVSRTIWQIFELVNICQSGGFSRILIVNYVGKFIIDSGSSIWVVERVLI